MSEKRFLLEWNWSRGTARKETGESDPVGNWSCLAPPRAPHLQPHLLTVGSEEKIWIKKSMVSNLRESQIRVWLIRIRIDFDQVDPDPGGKK